MSNAVEKKEVCKKQTSVVVLLEFGDQRLQHIHHLTLPVRGKCLQMLGELRGSEHRRRVQAVLKKLVCPNTGATKNDQGANNKTARQEQHESADDMCRYQNCE